ncbi:bifunctional diaminohydroxyphosphoribosylaminopyrimidine deaminase/5-amino-6-(5-phosphoribosylamino)uracil reductase RibD [Nevskia soli]|uniref:bifunctional diaminohydroxyphosphoribosylaminopyrimidine deaminase/5-amino-6-(5-phosphoribosylamino)uracil reductase RibD n=1 Tax=Nevskia soli TaxID=418856 RepID=UPI0004A76936|nr:bifunctional diaminohydroxyphosphoribosylaminopyrimidine deaminase/5-amino-6-(5-phosphoribosylamino)uracil reductase RibD [Nevskia soli]
MSSNADEVLAKSFMARALRLAERGRASTQPNPRVGCVIARDGLIVGEGFHLRAGEPHAEVLALHAAGEKAAGAEVYVTLEPCAHHGRTPPCVDALIAAKPKRVWVAMQDPNPLVAGKGLAKLREAGIEVHVGVMGELAAELNRGFVSRMTRGRPWVTLKLAASLDGRTAMASGESQWITGEAARADVHRLRAEAGAVMTSSATVLEDDPQLTVRLDGTWRQPDRIVLDTHHRVPFTAKVWAEGARRFLLTTDTDVAPSAPGVEVLTARADGAGHVDLCSALDALGRSQVNEVLVECGPRLAGAFVQARLVDEIVVYLAPSLLGHDAQPLAHLPGMVRLDQRVRLKPKDVRLVGDDIRVTAVLESKEKC